MHIPSSIFCNTDQCTCCKNRTTNKRNQKKTQTNTDNTARPLLVGNFHLYLHFFCILRPLMYNWRMSSLSRSNSKFLTSWTNGSKIMKGVRSWNIYSRSNVEHRSQGILQFEYNLNILDLSTPCITLTLHNQNFRLNLFTRFFFFFCFFAWLPDMMCLHHVQVSMEL